MRTAEEVEAEFELTNACVGQLIAQYEEANGKVERHRRGPLRKDAIPMEASVCGRQGCETCCPICWAWHAHALKAVICCMLLLPR